MGLGKELLQDAREPPGNYLLVVRGREDALRWTAFGDQEKRPFGLWHRDLSCLCEKGRSCNGWRLSGLLGAACCRVSNNSIPLCSANHAARISIRVPVF